MIRINRNSPQARDLKLLLWPTGVGANGTGNIAEDWSENNNGLVFSKQTNILSGSLSSGFADPACVAITPDSQFAFVTNVASTVVNKINLSTMQQVGTATIPALAIGIKISSDGQWVYTANTGGNTISKINTSTLVVYNLTLPYGVYNLALSSDNQTLYAASQSGNCVYKINVSNTTMTILATSQTINGATCCALNSDGSELWVSSTYYDRVTHVKTSDMSIIGVPITVDARPVDILVSPDNLYVFVACLNSAWVNRVVVASSVVTRITVGIGARFFSLSTDKKNLYVSCTANREIYTIDISTLSASLFITLSNTSESQRGISITPDGYFLIIAGQGANTLYKYGINDNCVRPCDPGALSNGGAYLQSNKTLAGILDETKDFTVSFKYVLGSMTPCDILGDSPPDGYAGFKFYVYNSSAVAFRWFGNNTLLGTVYGIYMPLNTMHTITVTVSYTSGFVTSYHDGKVVNTVAIGGVITQPTSVLKLFGGGNYINNQYSMPLLLSNLAIWQRALNASEVMDLYLHPESLMDFSDDDD